MQNLGHRMRLPRRRARVGDGRTRPRGRRHRCRSGQDRRARRPGARRSSSRACPRSSPRPARPVGCGSAPTSPMPPDADVHFLAVGTPQSADGARRRPAIRRRRGRRAAAAPARGRPRRRQEHRARRHGRPARRRVAEAAPRATLAWNPEFLREGYRREGHARARSARVRRRRPTRRGIRARRGLPPPRSSAGTPRIVTDYATAELVKVAANAFLATKISFINAMAEIAEATGADVTALADAIGHDARIGRRFLNAGRRLRRRLPAEGHPGVHRARRGARPRRVARVPQGGRRHQPPAAAARRRPRRRGARRIGVRQEDRRARRHVQARLRRRARLARARRGRAAQGARGRGRRDRPRGHRERACAPSAARCTRPSTAGGAARTPTSSCSSPSGASTATSTPCTSRASHEAGRSSTAATCSTRRPGAPPAGTTGAWVGPEPRVNRATGQPTSSRMPASSASTTADAAARRSLTVPSRRHGVDVDLELRLGAARAHHDARAALEHDAQHVDGGREPEAVGEVVDAFDPDAADRCRRVRRAARAMTSPMRARSVTRMEIWPEA